MFRSLARHASRYPLSGNALQGQKVVQHIQMAPAMQIRTFDSSPLAEYFRRRRVRKDIMSGCMTLGGGYLLFTGKAIFWGGIFFGWGAWRLYRRFVTPSRGLGPFPFGAPFNTPFSSPLSPLSPLGMFSQASKLVNAFAGLFGGSQEAFSLAWQTVSQSPKVHQLLGSHDISHSQLSVSSASYGGPEMVEINFDIFSPSTRKTARVKGTAEVAGGAEGAARLPWMTPSDNQSNASQSGIQLKTLVVYGPNGDEIDLLRGSSGSHRVIDVDYQVKR